MIDENTLDEIDNALEGMANCIVKDRPCHACISAAEYIRRVLGIVPNVTTSATTANAEREASNAK